MYFDVHNHLCQYKNPEEIIMQSKSIGVTIFAVSMSLKDCLRTLQLAGAHANVRAFLGFHPMHVAGKKFRMEFLEKVDALLEKQIHQVAGIGEIGLDKYFFKEKNFDRQLKVFDFFLNKAEELRLGVTIHGKDAEREVFQALSTHDIHPIAIHWYSGPEDLLKVGVDRGYFFSLTPAIKTSPKHRHVAEFVPLDLLLTETDGPYKFRDEHGRKTIEGVPMMIPDIVNEIGEIKGKDFEEVRTQLAENAKKFLK
ncbi:MAG: TatD family hydrolase [Candidatus Helarchaeota archaeon]